MKGSKQSRTDLLEKKLQATINIIKQLLDENAYLKDLAVGSLETIKLMPGYDEALEKLKQKLKEDGEKEKVEV
jgi:beta-phosphoglucomutase-like phosphatase (HAD superfamily)